MTSTEYNIGRRPEERAVPEPALGRWSMPKTGIAAISIVVVGILAYWLFFVPALFMDDWTSVVERVMTGNAQWFDGSQRRPLLFSVFLAQYQLLGLNLVGYYFVLWGLYALTALIIYLIVGRLPLPYRHEFGLVTALLFLVYPANYTHMWAIMVGVYVSLFLTLLYAYLLLRFAQEGRWLLLALALVCLLFSLGIYEAQLGVAALWALVLAVGFRRAPNKIRLFLLSPLVIMVLFALWRTVGFQSTGIDDKYLSAMVITPQVLISRLLLGYKIMLGWGWTAWLEESIARPGAAKIAVVLICAVVALIWLVVRRFSIHYQRRGEDRKPWEAPQDAISTYLLVSLLGLLLLGAGYAPVMFVFLPSLSGIGSRFNLYATIGSSLFIASLLMVGSLLLARYRTQVVYLFLAAAIPFLAIGVATQASVQYHNRAAWQEQKALWSRLFQVAPNLKDDTFVLFVLPGLEERSGFRNWKRTPLSASWEASSALRLLYDNPTLAGDVIFPDIVEPIEPELTGEGLLTQETGALTPYAEIVAIVYDQNAGSVERLEVLPGGLIPELSGPVRLCADCIDTAEAAPVALRALVETHGELVDTNPGAGTEQRK